VSILVVTAFPAPEHRTAVVTAFEAPVPQDHDDRGVELYARHQGRTGW
jgi:hypothetical protein